MVVLASIPLVWYVTTVCPLEDRLGSSLGAITPTIVCLVVFASGTELTASYCNS
jgi:hypothetical protein